MGIIDQFRGAVFSIFGNSGRRQKDAIKLINEGNVIERQGLLDDAMKRYMAAIEKAPKLGRAHLNRGNILQQKGDSEGALSAFDFAINCQPDYAAPYYNKGNLLHQLGRTNEAVASFERAIAVQPQFAEALNNLGIVFRDIDQYKKAADCFRQAIEAKPNFAMAHSNLGNVLQILGTLELAEESCSKALSLDANNAMIQINLGNVLQALGKGDSAIACYRRAIEIDPTSAAALNNLGILLHHCDQPDAAIRCFRQALEIDPKLASTHNNLGGSLAHGQLGQALLCFRRALEIDPSYSDAHSNLLFNLAHSETISPEALYSEHHSFAEKFETPLLALWPKHGNSPDPERQLRIGFVSADLRNHAVAHFVEPVLKELSSFPTLQLHAYYNHTFEDNLSRHLKGYLRAWFPIAALSDSDLAQKIVDDRIDILIDLSGHTGKNRLLTFARKPAPIQVSWIGYPCTTGLRAMDYYIADRCFLPTTRFDNQFSEKIVCLPASTPFLPISSAPPVNSLPALKNGYLTFASFNRTSKLNRAVIALWSQLLRALPTARLLIGSMPINPSESAPLGDWFADEGIASERLTYHPRSDMNHYLTLHHQVDICLDTFPYSGGTTTNHALWMGVPTLTLDGATPPGRQGAANLAYVGLEAFIASDAEDFVQKGLSWAKDLPALAEVRNGLRSRFEQSDVRHPKIVAKSLDIALRTMWQRWCAEMPPEAFTVNLTNRNINDNIS